MNDEIINANVFLNYPEFHPRMSPNCSCFLTKICSLLEWSCIWVAWSKLFCIKWAEIMILRFLPLMMMISDILSLHPRHEAETGSSSTPFQSCLCLKIVRQVFYVREVWESPLPFSMEKQLKETRSRDDVFLWRQTLQYCSLWTVLFPRET